MADYKLYCNNPNCSFPEIEKESVYVAYSSEKREIYHPYLCKKSEDGNIKYISIPNNINMDYILKFKAIELIKEGKIKIRLEDKI